jgi:predicted MFS family arabinose efflux permease
MPIAVWTAAVVAAYLNVMNGILQSFFPLLGVAAGMSLAQIGTLSGIRTAISSIARFGAGWTFDRIPPRVLHVPLLTASALSVAALPLTAASFVLTLPLMALSGISRGLLRVTTSADAMDALSGRRAGPAAALMTSGLDAGKIVGPLLGGVVAAAVGLEAMFVVVPVAFLIVALVGYVLARAQRSRTDPQPAA